MKLLSSFQLATLFTKQPCTPEMSMDRSRIGAGLRRILAGSDRNRIVMSRVCQLICYVICSKI